MRPPATERGGRADEKGTSLVEMSVMTVVIVAGLAGVTNACIRMHELQRLDQEVAAAYRACFSNLEDLRSVPIANLPALNGTGYEVPGQDGTSPGLAAQPHDPDGLPGVLRIEEQARDAGRVVYRITAAVAWRGASGDSSVQLTTLVGGAP